jgi:hypothetical protein
VAISGNEVADGLARQAVESGTVHGQMTTRYWLLKQWLSSGNMVGGQETLVDLLIQYSMNIMNYETVDHII